MQEALLQDAFTTTRTSAPKPDELYILSISELLYEKNVIVNQDVFKAKAILRGLASKVPTGKFLLEGKVSDKVLIDLIFKNCIEHI